MVRFRLDLVMYFAYHATCDTHCDCMNSHVA